jgi:dipeptidyl aminopeptidase/acylaminoacyl peptidase
MLRDVSDYLGAAKELQEEAWLRALGVRNGNHPRVAEVTPFRHAGRGTAPVLLIHGEKATSFDAEHSRLMHRRLKDAGRRSELVIIPGEDHVLDSAAGRLRMLQETLRFLERENPA